MTATRKIVSPRSVAGRYGKVVEDTKCWEAVGTDRWATRSVPRGHRLAGAAWLLYAVRSGLRPGRRPVQF